jgi:hypothetical protein
VADPLQARTALTEARNGRYCPKAHISAGRQYGKLWADARSIVISSENPMSSFKWNTISSIGAIVAVTLVLPNLAVAQSQGTANQADQPNRVVVEYVAPNSPDHQDLYETLKTRGALEKIQKILSPLRLPEELTIKTAECGKVNSWYGRENFKPTITICHELLKQILDSLPKETTPAEVTPDDAKIGQFLWLTLHEVGHAVFDIFGVPIFGHVEDAADNFATYVMLQFSESRRLIRGAAWAWASYMVEHKRNPVVRVRLEGFAGNHGLPQERFYNLLCMAFGANSELFADLTQDGYLPPTRAPNCQYEYKTMAEAFRKEIRPHIDLELAKGIVEANWLPDPVLKDVPQK